MNTTQDKSGVTSRPRLSVFFPAYNDEGSIGDLVAATFALLPQVSDDYEVIVVNDGSQDGTTNVLAECMRRWPQLRVIQHPQNRGYGGALRSGFAAATKDWVFYTDGDGQYDVKELTALLTLLDKQVDVVNGYKRQRADAAQRVILGSIYQRLARLLFGLPIRDVDCDFRLLRRSVVQQLDLHSTSGSICTELIYKLHAVGCRFRETPVAHYPRQHGRSQFFTLRRVARTAQDFFAMWFRLVVVPQMHRLARKPQPQPTNAVSWTNQ